MELCLTYYNFCIRIGLSTILMMFLTELKKEGDSQFYRFLLCLL